MDHPTEHPQLFTRRGHLTELTLDRYLLEELDADANDAVEDHLDDCSSCTEELTRARSLYDEPAEPWSPVEEADSPPEHEDVVDLDEVRRRRRIVGGTIVAVACSFALFLALPHLQQEVSTPQEPSASTDGPLQSMDEPATDRVRLRGEGVSMEIWVQDDTRDDAPRRAENGEIVHPGDRISFRTYLPEPGELMIVGIDSRREVYLGFPLDGSERSQFVEEHPRGKDLEVALRLDDVLGDETFLMIHCAEPFRFDDVEAILSSTGTGRFHEASMVSDDDCAVDNFSLEKKRRDDDF